MNTCQQTFINELPERSIAFVVSNTVQLRNYDVGYPFRQNSNFYYLTHTELTPAIWAVLKTTDTVNRTLFYTPKPIDQQKWVGLEVPEERLRAQEHWDYVLAYEGFQDWLETEIVNIQNLYLPYQAMSTFPAKLWDTLQNASRQANRRGGYAPQIHDVYSALAPLRQIKQPEELESIREACKITAEAHLHVMKTATPNMTEVQLASEFEHFCKMKGAMCLAYPTIVAGGKNATVLHYEPQSLKTPEGDLVLVDAGCEWQYYASDITRTFPVANAFTPAQQDIYHIVLEAQKAVINKVKPGTPYQQLQDTAIRKIAEGLKQLAILNTSMDEILEEKLYEKYYYHSVGHFMGLDVHDTGPYRKPDQTPVELAAGMVMTIEPGLYFFDEDSPEDFKGIGIRIEDDVLVTSGGHEVLTEGAPKTIADIEDLRSGV